MEPRGVTMTQSSFEAPKNPCVGRCDAVKNADGICRGCFRTEMEVINWRKMTDEEKLDTTQMMRMRKRKLSQ
jgi:predicted Fe-S protein YdhL (DUF1289 family)